jgi:hypothetical protein
MKLKATTWVLITVLIAVAAYFFLVDEKNRAAKEQESRKTRKLFSYTRANIEQFVLVNPKGERVEVANRNGTWSVVSPVEAPGDQPEIESFLDQVVPGRRGIELTNVRNPADYGLDTPFATLILYHTGANSPDTLFVGDKTPTSSNAYVRLGSSKNVLISSEITHNVMNKGLFHLRDKDFLPPGAESVTTMTIHDGRETLALKKEGAYWWFVAPHVRANRPTIEAYLSRLTDAVIHQFVREDTKKLAPYGLENPTRKITLTKRQETLTISFGNTEKDLVNVVRTGLDKVVLLERSFLAPFDWNLGNLRAMNLAFFDEDSVRTVRYQAADTAVVFTRTRTKWSTAAVDTAAMKWWEVNGLLRTLDSVTFEKIVREPLPAEEPRFDRIFIRVILEDARGSVMDRITIAAGSNGRETGGSMSANALGTLAPGTAGNLEMIFRKIGAK